jgi:hypothetical protein
MVSEVTGSFCVAAATSKKRWALQVVVLCIRVDRGGPEPPLEGTRTSAAGRSSDRQGEEGKRADAGAFHPRGGP